MDFYRVSFFPPFICPPFSQIKLFTCGHDAWEVVGDKGQLTMKTIRSHVMILGIVAVLTVYFFWANRRQGKLGKPIEGTVRFLSVPSFS